MKEATKNKLFIHNFSQNFSFVEIKDIKNSLFLISLKFCCLDRYYVQYKLINLISFKSLYMHFEVRLVLKRFVSIRNNRWHVDNWHELIIRNF